MTKYLLAILLGAILFMPQVATAQVQDFTICENTSVGVVTCNVAGKNIGIGRRTRIFSHNIAGCAGSPSVLIQGRDEETEMWHDILTIGPGGTTSRDDITAYNWIRGTTLADIPGCTGFNIIARTRWAE